MSSIQNTSQLFEPLETAAASLSRLNGTPWANSMLARGFYRCVEFCARVLARLGVSADVITYTSMLMAVLAGAAVALRQPGLAAALVLVSGSFDLLDGAVARTTNSATRWGALLDSTLDRVADAAPLIGIVIYYIHWSWAAAATLLTLVAGFVISYVRARAEALGVQLPSLFMRRAERVLLVAASLGLGMVHFDAESDSPLMLAGVTLTGLLSVVGAWSILSSARVALKSNAA